MVNPKRFFLQGPQMVAMLLVLIENQKTQAKTAVKSASLSFLQTDPNRSTKTFDMGLTRNSSALSKLLDRNREGDMCFHLLQNTYLFSPLVYFVKNFSKT